MPDNNIKIYGVPLWYKYTFLFSLIIFIFLIFNLTLYAFLVILFKLKIDYSVINGAIAVLPVLFVLNFNYSKSVIITSSDSIEKRNVLTFLNVICIHKSISKIAWSDVKNLKICQKGNKKNDRYFIYGNNEQFLFFVIPLVHRGKELVEEIQKKTNKTFEVQ